MEPERRIEKLLRAYARKRRGQAGGAFGLHPATRRLLHGEITRKSQEPEEEDDSPSLWEVLRQHWAFLLGFAFCAFLVGLIFMPMVHTTKEKGQFGSLLSAEKLNETNEAGENRSAPSGGPEIVTATTPAIAGSKHALSNDRNPSLVAGTNNNPAAGMVVMNEAPAMPPAAEAPTPKRDESLAAARGDSSKTSYRLATTDQLSFANGKLRESRAFPHGTNTLPATDSGGSLLASAPVAHPPSTGAADQDLLDNPQTFAASREIAGNRLNLFKNFAAASNAIPVLANFQVRQTGNSIQIVDEDGSVYNGSLRKVNVMTQGAESRRTGQAQPWQTAPAPGNRPQSQQPVSESYTFRVRGINRTLNQPVVFTGRLLGEITAAKDMQQTRGLTANFAGGAGLAQNMLKSGMTNQAAQLPWSQLRIAGTVIVNKTNHIPVNAAPVGAVGP